MSFNGRLAKISYGIFSHTEGYGEAINNAEVVLHRLIQKDEGDIGEKASFKSI